MKRITVLGLLAVLAISGCQVKEEGEFAPEGKTFTATMESIADDAAGVDTKTSMDSYGNVLWKKGDQVSIFVASTINQHFQVTDASDGKTAAALNPVESSSFVAGGDIPNNVAYYPYAATAAIAKRSGGSYLISDIALPATQYYASASFGNGAFPMTAVTSSKSDYNLKFMNVLGGLKLQLKGTAAITSISVSGNNNEKLCGAADVTVSGTTAPSINLTDATAKTITLDCGDGVQLDVETATVFIIALPPLTMTGGFTVTVTDTENKQMEIKTTKSQTITRSNLLSMPAVTYEGTGSIPASEPVAVDLGLPSGLKWASFNVGANAPEEYGDYFAWGETEPFCGTYKWSNGSSYTKYCTNSSYGVVDNKTVLEVEDDAATVNWGGTWRMPTNEEWCELIEECTWTWTTQNGKNGYLITSSSNGNSIFLPAAGSCWYGLDSAGSSGRYWSSLLYQGAPWDTRAILFTSEYFYTNGFNREQGFSVRPVSDEGVRVSVTGVSLNKSNLALVEGGTESLMATVTPSNATQPAVIWSSSNTDVATVDYNGVVTAVSAGNATITATTHDGGFTATCAVTVSAVPEAVDLGLSVKWATFNVGASKPEEYGDYFAWGDISPREDVPGGAYAWAVYKWCNGSYSSMQKYNTNPSYGVVDGVTTLELEDDAAAAIFGDNWRMPTAAEQKELLDNCTWICTTRNGINGNEVVSNKNGNSIFLPAAGYKGDNSNIEEDGEVGLYWSSSLTEGSSTYTSCRLRFAENEIDHIDINRSFALQIRPVYCETITPESVDLGLSSGLKWATCNVGANAPEEYGDYFAWGETEPYYSSQNPLTWKDGKEAGYEWPSYQWYDATNDSQTKYCYGVDNKTVLDPEDDAAIINWGGTWRMPTDADWTELRTECTWTWTTHNGVYGRLVTSNTNGKSIFLPAAGYMSGTGYTYTGSYGEYWSSSLNDYYSYAALYTNFSSDGVWRNGHVRCLGRSVRPVTE